MKLKNKKTGEIVEFFNNTDGILPDSLTELCEEWEDVPKEPKEYWVILNNSGVARTNEDDECLCGCKEIGNYFSSREEAERVVEKLKAWKRLKDNGFKTRFYLHNPFLKNNIIEFSLDGNPEEYYEEFQTLFGGEE